MPMPCQTVVWPIVLIAKYRSSSFAVCILQVGTQSKIGKICHLKRKMPAPLPGSNKLAATRANRPSREAQATVLEPCAPSLLPGVKDETAPAAQAAAAGSLQGGPSTRGHAAAEISRAAQPDAATLAAGVVKAYRKEPYRCQLCAYFLKEDRLKTVCSKNCPALAAGHTKDKMVRELAGKLRGTGKSSRKLGWKDLVLL